MFKFKFSTFFVLMYCTLPKIESERNDLYSNFVAVVGDIHQRSQMKTTLLEKRLSEVGLPVV